MRSDRNIKLWIGLPSASNWTWSEIYRVRFKKCYTVEFARTFGSNGICLSFQWECFVHVGLLSPKMHAMNWNSFSRLLTISISTVFTFSHIVSRTLVIQFAHRVTTCSWTMQIAAIYRNYFNTKPKILLLSIRAIDYSNVYTVQSTLHTQTHTVLQKVGCEMDLNISRSCE